MFEIRRYTAADEAVWNKFVAQSKNGTFLFNRAYMDYHSHRFNDFSLLFHKNNRLFAVMPAHRCDDTFCTHLGLTYGGLIMGYDATAADVVVLFEELNEYLQSAGFRKVVYRSIPWVYHRLPSEEDLYAMFWKCHPHIKRRMAGTVIAIDRNLTWRKDHRRRLQQAHSKGVTVKADASLDEFWPLLESNLQQRFAASPVHSLEEIKLLKSRFPDSIIQYSAYLDGQIIGGVTFYVMGHVLHGQYSSTNDIGKQSGAMEAIYEQVLYHDFRHFSYLDFGTSNEEGGRVLNEGLIAHKEGYGGRTVCYDTYEWEL